MTYTANTANTDTAAAADAYAASIVAFERAVAESEYNQDTLRAAQECAYHGRPTAPLAIVPPRRIADMLAQDTPQLFANRATAAGIDTLLAYRYAWLVRPAAVWAIELGTVDAGHTLAGQCAGAGTDGSPCYGVAGHCDWH